MRRQTQGWTWIAGLAWALALGCGDDGVGEDAAVDDGGSELETAPDGGEDGEAEAVPDGDLDGEADAAPDGEEDEGGGDEGGATVDPTAEGPYGWSVVDGEVVRGSRTTPVSALLPDGPGTPMPMLLFLPGFQMRSAWYLPLLERIASHGFVVVRADPPSTLLSSSHPEQASDAAAVLDWALDPEGPLAGRVDAARVAAGGHSAGGKISTMLAFADARVTALLGLDPVNGSGPFGYTADQPDIVPEQVEPLAIPIGLLGETTDATAGLGGQACAPAAQNFQTFFDAATSSPWVTAWELEGADHIDFVFDTSTCGLPCSLCRNGSADPAVVRATTQTLAVAFLRLVLLDEAEQEAWLLGDLLPGGVVLQHRP